MSQKKRQVKIGFSIWATGRHASAWRLPEAYLEGVVEPEFLAETIRTCERGLFDYYFVGSENHSAPELQNTRHNDLLKPEPFTLAAYAAAITTHIGIVPTFNTTYADPYYIARSSAMLDHLSKGRAGLNIVTGRVNSPASVNFGQSSHLGGDDKYDRAEEFVEALRTLWDSWEDGWLVGDKQAGTFIDVTKAHKTNFIGKHFSIEGPLNIPRPPQGHIPILHAGTSERSKEYGAQYADIRFIRFSETGENKDYYHDIKSRLAKFGRRGEDQFLIPGITFYPAESDREAHAKFREVQNLSVNTYAPKRLSDALGIDLSNVLPSEKVLSVIDLDRIPDQAWAVRNAIQSFDDEGITLKDLFHFYGNLPLGQPPIVGSGRKIADWIEHQFEERALDGVKIFPPYMPGSLEAFVNYVIPELQRKEIFRTAYETSTLRGHLGLDVPQNRFSDSRRTAASLV